MAVEWEAIAKLREEERDRARAWAARVEAENAELTVALERVTDQAVRAVHEVEAVRVFARSESARADALEHREEMHAKAMRKEKGL